jgi:hypothetical protein
MGLLGILGMVTLGQKGMESGNKTTLAVNLSQEKMEEKWAASPDSILWDDLDQDGKMETKMIDLGQGEFTNEDQPYNGMVRQWSIQYTLSGLMLIDVKTLWKDEHQKNRSFSLRGLRVQNNL